MKWIFAPSALGCVAFFFACGSEPAASSRGDVDASCTDGACEEAENGRDASTGRSEPLDARSDQDNAKDACGPDGSPCGRSCRVTAGCFRVEIVNAPTNSPFAGCPNTDFSGYRREAELDASTLGPDLCSEEGAVVSTAGSNPAACTFETSCDFQNLGYRVHTSLDGNELTHVYVTRAEGTDACTTTVTYEKVDEALCVDAGE